MLDGQGVYRQDDETTGRPGARIDNDILCEASSEHHGLRSAVYCAEHGNVYDEDKRENTGKGTKAKNG